ncbi:hypothetical protein LINPERPRIM_LOCUS24142, partial [Linum perenne]
NLLPKNCYKHRVLCGPTQSQLCSWPVLPPSSLHYQLLIETLTYLRSLPFFLYLRASSVARSLAFFTQELQLPDISASISRRNSVHMNDDLPICFIFRKS